MTTADATRIDWQSEAMIAELVRDAQADLRLADRIGGATGRALLAVIDQQQRELQVLRGEVTT